MKTTQIIINGFIYKKKIIIVFWSNYIKTDNIYIPICIQKYIQSNKKYLHIYYKVKLRPPLSYVTTFCLKTYIFSNQILYMHTFIHISI